MIRGLAFDPGGCTGVVEGTWSLTMTFRRTGYWAVQGGAQGLAEFLVGYIQKRGRPDVVVSETFVPDGTPGGRETVSPQCEGVLIREFLGMDIQWQSRGEKAWGYDSREESDAKIQEVGLWLTGTEVGWEDGRDVNDAQLHILQYLRKQRHLPTLRWLFPPH